MTTVERREDAPGWNIASPLGEGNNGPVCWKCVGVGTVKKKKKREGVVTATCPVCFGQKRLKPKKCHKRKRRHDGDEPRKQRLFPEGYVVSGTIPVAENDLEKNDVTELADDEELCCLVGRWKIVQQIRGHRWSTDDLVTAWLAISCVEKYMPKVIDREYFSDPVRCLDLGCGIGSVLLMMAWKFHELDSFSFTGIEAQEASFLSCLRNVKYNLGGKCLGNKMRVFNHDFRSCEAVLQPEEQFDVITGTPPYFRVETTVTKAGELVTTPKFGGMPTFKQSAPARYEFRGGFEAYVATAKKLLSPNGLFIVCQGVTPKENKDRVYKSCEAHGFKIIAQLDVKGKEQKPVLFSVYCLVHRAAIGDVNQFQDKQDLNPYRWEQKLSSDPGDEVALSTIRKLKESVQEITVRDKNSERTSAYTSLMLDMGIPP